MGASFQAFPNQNNPMNKNIPPPDSRPAAAAGTSPFLLIFRDAGSAIYERLSAEERQRLLEQWYAWYDGLAAAGKVRDGHPLEPAGRMVTASGGRVVDGPFVEGKEVVGGYFLLDVSGIEEAVEIAKQCPSFKHGLGIRVEVRPVAGVCPVLRAEKTVANAAN
jgi:hypothetical protein